MLVALLIPLAIVDLAAIVLLVLGLRTSAAARARALALGGLGCLLTVAFVTVLGVLLGLADAFDRTATADPSEKATLLARGISETMNGTVMGLLAMVLPALTLVVLSIRAGRMRKSAGAASRRLGGELDPRA